MGSPKPKMGVKSPLSLPPVPSRFWLGCVITSAISVILFALFHSSAGSAPPAHLVQPEAASPESSTAAVFVGAGGVSVSWRAERLTRREEVIASRTTACGSARRREEPVFPRIIHQTWKERELPTMFKGWMQSCHDHNPTMEHYVYTHASLQALLDEHFPGFSAVWDELRGITLADVGRLLVLWIYGGIYQDMDYECLRPYEGLLQEAEAQGKDFIVGEEHLLHVFLLEHVDDEARPFVSNAWIAATPRHPLIGEFLNQTVQTLGNATTNGDCQGDPIGCTGPQKLTALIHKALDMEDESQPCERPPLGSVMVTDFDVVYGEYAASNNQLAHYCKRDPASFKAVLPTPRNPFATEWWAWQGCALLALAEDDSQIYVASQSVAVHHWMCSWCGSSPRLRRSNSFDVRRDAPWVVLK
ncbi:unnamed protein product [Vitrella brassicaformis CCMP3155]|uniref:Alpha 1,4-glycosyltransferase domain-containing protein n=1 Tax=Vitrella brassicaformis (strain CCMP3155) TaxID=1169540 RepID=A0A0G4GHX4_VITBC|nr:unnamed protein product [Vitrella brassicaformis CCMP3155]|eukprot:CEM29345.1 unnamed protein product [Vitrella brassicaformis CCMP3155]